MNENLAIEASPLASMAAVAAVASVAAVAAVARFWFISLSSLLRMLYAYLRKLYAELR